MKGIKKYIFFGLIFAIMIWYCVDENLPRALVIAVIQLLLMVSAAMIRKDIFPVNLVYRYPKLPVLMLAFSLLLIGPFCYFSSEDQYNGYLEERSRQTFTWPRSGLAEELPEPISDYGEIWTDNDLEFRVDMYNVSESRYNSYVKACKRMGFDDVLYEYEGSFSAVNEEGYDLNIWWSSNNEMSVTLRSPKKLEYLELPDNEMLSLLPEIENPYGRIDADRSGYFAICLGHIYDNSYKDYVSKCREAGFIKNYERKSDMYQAEDSEGNLLLLDFDNDLSTMYLQIWSAEQLSRNAEKIDESNAEAEETNIEADETDADAEEADTETEETLEKEVTEDPETDVDRELEELKKPATGNAG